jgi:hypothetical protein
MAFLRSYGDRRFLVALNLGHGPSILETPSTPVDGTIVVGTHVDREGMRVRDRLELDGDEGLVIELD